MASTIVTAIILLIYSEITYLRQLVVMNFIFGKALLSLLFYTDNPYLFTTFSKILSLLFPYFSVDGHLKACILMGVFNCYRRANNMSIVLLHLCTIIV